LAEISISEQWPEFWGLVAAAPAACKLSFKIHAGHAGGGSCQATTSFGWLSTRLTHADGGRLRECLQHVEKKKLGDSYLRPAILKVSKN